MPTAEKPAPQAPAPSRKAARAYWALQAAALVWLIASGFIARSSYERERDLLALDLKEFDPSTGLTQLASTTPPANGPIEVVSVYPVEARLRVRSGEWRIATPAEVQQELDRRQNRVDTVPRQRALVWLAVGLAPLLVMVVLRLGVGFVGRR